MAFKSFLSKEDQALVEYWKGVQKKKEQEAREKSDIELARTLENNMKNLTAVPRYHEGAPIYEAQLIQTLLPEVIRRLKGE